MTSPPTGSPSTVTCRVLKLARQPSTAGSPSPVSDRDWDDAYLTNAALRRPRRRPRVRLPVPGRRARRGGLSRLRRTGCGGLCSQRLVVASAHASAAERQAPGPPVHDDLVGRDFTAEAPNQLWLTDITEHPTGEGKLYLCAIKDACSQPDRRLLDRRPDEVPARRRPRCATRSPGARAEPSSPAAWSTPTGAARADSTGRRNTLITEVCDGTWQEEERMCPRARVGSGGGSGASAGDALAGPAGAVRAVQREFWRLIATGVTTAEAASAVGVSGPVGSRWFRHAGGMPPISLAEPVGPLPVVRRARGDRDAARPGASACARSPADSGATRGRSLASCAATPPRAAVSWSTGRRSRSGRPQQAAKRPKAAKLVDNDRLRDYVQERLAGQVRRPDGTSSRAREQPGGRGEQAPPAGPAVGDGVESGADLEPAEARLPR